MPIRCTHQSCAAPRAAAPCTHVNQPAAPRRAEEEAYEISVNKISGLLAERTKYYENADVVVPLKGYGKDADAGAPAAVVMHRLLSAVREKIRATKEEREARRQFVIEQGGDVPTMRKQQSPSLSQQPAEE